MYKGLETPSINEGKFAMSVKNGTKHISANKMKIAKKYTTMR